MVLRLCKAVVPGTGIGFSLECTDGMAADPAETMAMCRRLGFTEMVRWNETTPAELLEPTGQEATRGFFYP